MQHNPDSYNIAQKLFIRDGNKLLIVRGADTGKLDFPGGRINVDEFSVSLKKSLMREVKEEVGSALKFKVNIQPIVLFRHQVPAGKHKGLRIFLIGYEAIYQAGSIKLSSEHSEYFWQDLDKVEDLENQFLQGIWEGVRQYLSKT